MLFCLHVTPRTETIIPVELLYYEHDNSVRSIRRFLLFILFYLSIRPFSHVVPPSSVFVCGSFLIHYTNVIFVVVFCSAALPRCVSVKVAKELLRNRTTEECGAPLPLFSRAQSGPECTISFFSFPSVSFQVLCSVTSTVGVETLLRPHAMRRHRSTPHTDWRQQGHLSGCPRCMASRATLSTHSLQEGAASTLFISLLCRCTVTSFRKSGKDAGGVAQQSCDKKNVRCVRHSQTQTTMSALK